MPEQATIRSPALDYPQAVAQTSNGEIVGADQQPPPDAIKTNAAVGTNGITPGGRPAPAELGTPRPKPPGVRKAADPDLLRPGNSPGREGSQVLDRRLSGEVSHFPDVRSRRGVGAPARGTGRSPVENPARPVESLFGCE